MNNNNLSINESSNLSQQFSEELLEPGIDLGIDYAEIFIDDLIDNPAFKEIPLLKSVVGVVKGGIAINQFFFAKKLLAFIQAFNEGKIDPVKKAKFQEKISSEEKYRKKVFEQVMVFVDRFIEVKKAKISAHLFKSYVEERITYEQFVSINIGLERLHPNSYAFLDRLSREGFAVDEDNPPPDRDHASEALLQTSGLGASHSVWSAGFEVTAEGKLLYEFGLLPLIHREP